MDKVRIVMLLYAGLSIALSVIGVGFFIEQEFGVNIDAVLFPSALLVIAAISGVILAPYVLKNNAKN